MCAATTHAVRKWMPPHTRAFSTSRMTLEKLSNLRAAAFGLAEVAVNVVSLPKKEASTAVAALLTPGCPAGYSWNAGVGSSGVQSGSGVVAGFVLVLACWIAVIGRQVS